MARSSSRDQLQATPAPKSARYDIAIRALRSCYHHRIADESAPIRLAAKQRMQIADHIEKHEPGLVISGDELRGWSCLADIAETVHRALIARNRRLAAEAQANDRWRNRVTRQTIAAHRRFRAQRAGRADPHTLLMLIVLVVALVVPMTAALMAESQGAGAPALHTPTQTEIAIISLDKQPTTPGVPMLTSIGAVVALTLTSVQVLKWLLADAGPHFAWAARWPTWSYAVIVAAAYTAAANALLHTLPGDFWQLAWQGVYNAAIASGFFEWWRHHDSAISNGNAQSATDIVTNPPNN